MLAHMCPQLRTSLAAASPPLVWDRAAKRSSRSTTCCTRAKFICPPFMGLFLEYVVPLDWSRPNSSDVRRVGGNGNMALHLRALISTSVVVLLTACGSASPGEPDQSEPWGYASALEGFIADA